MASYPTPLPGPMRNIHPTTRLDVKAIVGSKRRKEPQRHGLCGSIYNTAKPRPNTFTVLEIRKDLPGKGVEGIFWGGGDVVWCFGWWFQACATVTTHGPDH